MPEQREYATVPRERRIPPERRETVRARTEYRWPARMGEAVLSPRPGEHAHTQPSETTGGYQTTLNSPEKEAALASPTSFQFPPEPVYLEQEYHISPQVSQDMLSHKYKFGPDASLPDLAELPPNEVVPEQVHELPGLIPPMVYPQELDGSADTLVSPRYTISPTPTLTSRFSSRR